MKEEISIEVYETSDGRSPYIKGLLKKSIPPSFARFSEKIESLQISYT